MLKFIQTYPFLVANAQRVLKVTAELYTTRHPSEQFAGSY